MVRFHGSSMKKGIDHPAKGPRYINDISTLDRAIHELRKGLVKAGPVDQWQERLARVVKGMNAIPHSHLMGSAPKYVDDNEVLEFALRKEAALDLPHNDNIIRNRENKLETAGAFRT